jgi:hypothetical protein
MGFVATAILFGGAYCTVGYYHLWVWSIGAICHRGISSAGGPSRVYLQGILCVVYNNLRRHNIGGVILYIFTDKRTTIYTKNLGEIMMKDLLDRKAKEEMK